MKAYGGDPVMKALIDYMRKIRAEEELKVKTKSFVRSSLNRETPVVTNNASTTLKRRIVMKKLIITASVFAACAALAIGGYAFYHTPVSFVGLDINPSVELGVNAFDTVVSVQSYNEDGASIIADNNLTYLTVGEAMTELVKEAAEQGFIEEDGSTVIAVTAEGENEEKSKALQEAGEEGINKALQSCRVRAVIFANCADPELRGEAKALGISPGKYKMIKTLQALDPTITVDEFKDAKMKTIVAKAQELILSGTEDEIQTNKDLQETFKKMKEAEKQLRKNEKEAAKNGNGKGNDNGNANSGDVNSGSDSSGCTEQEKNANQNNGNGKSTEKEQEQNQNRNKNGSSSPVSSTAASSDGKASANSVTSSSPSPGNDSNSNNGNGKGQGH